MTSNIVSQQDIWELIYSQLVRKGLTKIQLDEMRLHITVILDKRLKHVYYANVLCVSFISAGGFNLVSRNKEGTASTNAIDDTSSLYNAQRDRTNR